MKTKIISIILAAVIMIGETSCFVRVRARTPRAKVRVRVYAPPADNQQQKSMLLPINHSTSSVIVNN
ncbi:MAG TPA: hypothetical protein VE978_02725 [Chitinophagales bacterium]|nr:hypothetical protein [Chitinophagales bacterium]